MPNRALLHNILEKCDIYFENELISREPIVRSFASFLISSFTKEEKPISLTLHTGSICFDVISVLISAIGTLFLDVIDVDETLVGLREGDMILYKNERYQWGGFGTLSSKNDFIGQTDIKDATHFLIEQRKVDKRMGELVSKFMVPITNRNLVIPYYGNSETTDGRGLRKKKSNPTDFFENVFGMSPSEIRSVASVSAIIVAERELADRLMKGISLSYGNGKSIDLLDIITASYFTEGDEYPYRGNSSKNDPVVKIASKISIARELILDKSGNTSVELIVLGADCIAKGKSEFPELLLRKSLKNIAVSINIDAENAEDIFYMIEGASVFACTKEFLQTVSLQQQEENRIVATLYTQIRNSIDKKINTIILTSTCPWTEYRKAKEALFFIKRHNWDGVEKEEFLMCVHSLLKLFSTAVFPLCKVEKYYNQFKANIYAPSPQERLRELWSLADKLPESLSEYALESIEVIEKLFYAQNMDPPKYKELKKILYFAKQKRIAVVVPKSYYIEILTSDNALLLDNVTIVTANRFDNSLEYDEIVIVGDFSGRRFDIVRSKAASLVTVLLYDYEQYLFAYKENTTYNFESHLNRIILGMEVDDEVNFLETYDTKPYVEDELLEFSIKSIDLEHYIDQIKSFDAIKYATNSISVSTTTNADVVAIGTFVTGEKALFTKYYKAFVFDATKGSVIETDIDKLSSGDVLVFTKRDSFTKNIVDNIFDSLIESRRLPSSIQAAEFKSKYWKLLLKEYMDNNQLTYREVSKRLSTFGCKRHEVTIRTWLSDDYRIIGPHDDEAFEQIAELTGDADLKSDHRGFYEACRIVRHKRREILTLMGQAIIDRLKGNIPQEGSLLEAVYDNVEKLAVTMELESILELSEPISVSVNLVNKPFGVEGG